ncbi:MAG TPA: hypothetical protein EYP56_01175, partial [Planctomycetaceae bacterium]|nr:hypothetical protein [Planctomycetaceae bacterium]
MGRPFAGRHGSTHQLAPLLPRPPRARRAGGRVDGRRVAVGRREAARRAEPLRLGTQLMLPALPPEWPCAIPAPGQNEKRYLAGALDARTGEIVWVEGESKNDMLFICLLWEVHQRYPWAKKIHVILDNYGIHSTKEVEKTLGTEAGRRFELHFLPPYCPDDNRIERLWEDLHANVTRNHKCSRMCDSVRNVRYYLRKRNRE